MIGGNDALLRDQILDLSRQAKIGELSSFLSGTLDQAIAFGYFPDITQLEAINDAMIRTTSLYREQTRRSIVVLGMKGAVLGLA